MTKSIIAFSSVLVVAILCATISWNIARAHSGERQVAYRDFEGKPAPHFTVNTIDGRNFVFGTGRSPALIELFATWCNHCQREVRVMNRLSSEFAGKVRFIAVATDPHGSNGISKASLSDVRGFARAYGAKYPISFDPTGLVRKEYEVPAYPEVLIVNKDGVVTYNAFGEVPYADLKSAVTSVNN